jgi:hypothetical protein
VVGCSAQHKDVLNKACSFQKFSLPDSGTLSSHIAEEPYLFQVERKNLGSIRQVEYTWAEGGGIY